MPSKNEEFDNQHQETDGSTAGLMYELELLRLSNLQNERLLRELQLLREKQESTISRANEELAQRIAQLEKANQEIREARRAALNLMEDAILSKEELRRSEEKYRIKLEGEVRERTAELKESQQQYASLVENTPDVISRWNKDLKLIYANSAFVTQTGINLERLYGRTHLEMEQPDHIAVPFMNSLRNVFETGEAIEHYYSYPTSQGEVNFHSRIMPETNEIGEVETVLCIARDVTDFKNADRKKAEEALRQSEERLRITLETALDFAVINTDTKGLVEGWNSGAERIFGFSAEEMIGNSSALLFTEEDKNEKVPDKEMSTARVNGFASDERWYKRKDGSRFYVSGVMRPIYSPDFKGFVKIVRDITEHKLLEQQKDDFIGIASHELKTPVTSIKAYAEFLNETFTQAKDFESADLVRKLNFQVDRLTELINALLDTTRIAEGQLLLTLVKFDLNTLIEERVNELQRTTQNHRLLFSSTAKVEVTGDKERISQVLTNLISNAIKYSPKGGDVKISLENKENGVEVSVKDSGVGIPEDAKDKIFERFYRMSNPKISTYPGMGLGLYISAAIIKRHNGKIWVESKSNEGSIFYFLLPHHQYSK